MPRAHCCISIRFRFDYARAYDIDSALRGLAQISVHTDSALHARCLLMASSMRVIGLNSANRVPSPRLVYIYIYAIKLICNYGKLMDTSSTHHQQIRIYVVLS